MNKKKFPSKTEKSEGFLKEKKQQEHVLRKRYKFCPITPTLTTGTKHGLPQKYCRFQDLNINESSQLLYFLRGTKPHKICSRLFLLLTLFANAHTHDPTGHPGEKNLYKYQQEHFSSNIRN